MERMILTHRRAVLLALLLPALTPLARAQVQIYSGVVQHRFTQTTDSGPVEAGFVKYRFANLVEVGGSSTIAAQA